MESRIIFSVLVIIALFTSSVFGASTASGPAVPAQETAVTAASDANQADTATYPYQGQVTANNVNVRSGPGENYYRCGQLNKGDAVTVVAKKLVWLKIVPPKNSFSWISKQYIEIDATTPDVGKVKGDNVRVWAGGDVRPLDSTTMQTRLSDGDKVLLLGEESDDYYKISPPDNAYLYVNADYVVPMPAAPAKGAEPQTGAAAKQPSQPAAAAQSPQPTPEVVPAAAKAPADAGKIDEYHQLEAKVKAEREKAMAQQDYAELKKALTDLASDPNGGKAARYSAFTLEQIKRYELAKKAGQELVAQNQQLEQAAAQIEKARSEKLAKIPDLGQFAAIGVLRTSALFDTPSHLRRYRLIGDDGTIICYAAPVEAISGTDLSNYIDKKVGLVGTIEPYLETKGALVRFSRIAIVE